MYRIRGKDWLILLLDAAAVNVSYYLALVLRFYLNKKFAFKVVEEVYPTWFAQFAPIYTVCCLVVFFLFRLYGGMWKYAGLSDMHRIILASLVTAGIQVGGTLLMFPMRMPHSYYIVGAGLQFGFITAFRFAYRFWLVEKRKFRNWRKIGKQAIIIGAGEAARRMVQDLENGPSFRPVCVIDSKGDSDLGRSMDGLPVYGGMDMLENMVIRYDAKYVFVADPLLQPELKNEIERVCREKGVELHDYGYAIYLSGREESGEVSETVAAETEGRKVIPFSPPDISQREIDEVVEAMRSGWITTGRRTKMLERRLNAFITTGQPDVDTETDPKQWKHRVVCLNSGTAAEELNLRILGIREGDEVIVPAYTYTATASAVVHCGAKVKFVDILKDGEANTHLPEMDWDALEASITPATKAVIAVDLAGVPADYDRIYSIVEKKKDLFVPLESDGTRLGDLSSRIQKGLGRVAVIADSAHALGASRNASGVKVFCGRMADFTSFSFHAVKNFTTAEGGASTWHLPQSVYVQGVTDDEIYRVFQLLSLHGQSKDALAKTKAGAWEYDITGPWYKCNMTDIMAAIGLRQLDRYPGLMRRRNEMIRKYDAVCDELGLQHLNHQATGVYSSGHLYLVRIPGADEEKRNRIITALAQEGVSTNVHYKPLPMMTAYRQMGWDIRDFPNAYDYYRNLLTLPLHTLLSDEDINTVCNALRKVIREA